MREEDRASGGLKGKGRQDPGRLISAGEEVRVLVEDFLGALVFVVALIMVVELFAES